MSFPVSYTRTLCRELGLDAAGQQALLAGTGLQPGDLLQINAVIDAPQQYRIVRNALQLSGDPGLGLRWGASLHAAAHGPLGALIAASPSLGQAWKAAERFQDLRGGFAHVRGLRRADHFAVVITLDAPDDSTCRFFTEATLATTLRHFEMITGHGPTGIRVQIGYEAPPHAARYAECLGVDCRFGCRQTEIRMPLGLGPLPNPFADMDTYSQTLQRCEQLRQALRHQAQWHLRVREILRQNPGRLWTAAEVASHLSLSARTLARHLQEEGHSYKGLQDAELSEQARHLLMLPRQSVENVALALGYQETSNFRRAFKRWFGLSPSAYLAQASRTD